MEIEITAMNKVSDPKPNKVGDVIVANFDAAVGPFFLHHCALVKIYNKSGEVYKGFAAWPPNVRAPKGRRGILISDKEFRKELMDAARSVFLALGGEE